jgi:hypothetical protein
MEIKYPCPKCCPEFEPGGAIDKGIEYAGPPDWPLLLDLSVNRGKLKFVRAQCEFCETFVLIEIGPGGMSIVEDHEINERKPTNDELLFKRFLSSSQIGRELFAEFQSVAVDHSVNGIGLIQTRKSRGDFDLDSMAYTTKDAARDAGVELSKNLAAREIVVVSVSGWKKFFGKIGFRRG